MNIAWKNSIIGSGDDCLRVGNESYFETSALTMSMLVKNTNKLHCPDKGYAECFDLVDGTTVAYNVAWMYPHPYPTASDLKGKVGFKTAQITFIS